jgi:hypothetical protein
VYVRASRLDEDERERKLSPAMQREKALAVPELVGVTFEVATPFGRTAVGAVLAGSTSVEHGDLCSLLTR